MVRRETTILLLSALAMVAAAFAFALLYVLLPVRVPPVETVVVKEGPVAPPLQPLPPFPEHDLTVKPEAAEVEEEAPEEPESGAAEGETAIGEAGEEEPSGDAAASF